MDLTAFRARRPEFANIADETITAALADAVKRLSVEVLGDRYDEAHMWLTAHLLASAPWGYQARLQGGPQGATVYSAALDQIVSECGAGYGVT